MKVAKIIRHRHRIELYMNDTLTGVEEEIHFKILFSTIDEKKAFEKWVRDKGGEYEWDGNNNKVAEKSKIPEIEGYDSNSNCWCSVGQHYLLNVAGYIFHSTLTPFKGEIYIK